MCIAARVDANQLKIMNQLEVSLPPYFSFTKTSVETLPW